jgi:hypothetical protein
MLISHSAGTMTPTMLLAARLRVKEVLVDADEVYYC